ncbi:MAG TPA: hypothetical protein VKV02_06730 [Acidobacteriaceae bacterium]|nr:hypothetical protein [Acidobacteriaceae bacterium]
MQHPHRILALALLTAVGVSGCRIETHKKSDGKDGDVDIGTPFGSMHVKTDDQASSAQTGLAVYPGATLVKKNGDDNGAADVSMNFGGFKIGVHAVDLQTPDPEDKVLAFYKKDMGRYGSVITCQGKEAVGLPVRTGEGLTCGSPKNQYTFSTSESDHLELRTGSETHQHIVGLHKENGGTRIGLVALDLPSGLGHHHDADDRE